MNFILLGFFVGILVGATGSGGGSLLTPFLILVANVAPSVAIGTDLWFSALTKISSGYIHFKRKTFDKDIIILLIFGCVPASILIQILLHLEVLEPIKQEFLRVFLGGTLLLTSIIMICIYLIQKFYCNLYTEDAYKLKKIPTIFAGFIIGIIVTLSSVGAGTIGASALIILYPLRLKAAKIIGTDVLYSIPLAIIAGIGYFFSDSIDYRILILLLVGSIPGTLISTYLVGRLPDIIGRIMIASMLFYAGIKLI